MIVLEERDSLSERIFRNHRNRIGSQVKKYYDGMLVRLKLRLQSQCKVLNFSTSHGCGSINRLAWASYVDCTIIFVVSVII